MVYFVMPLNGGPIKIGYTANFEKRMPGLCADYGRQFELLAGVAGDLRTERHFHDRFAHLRFGYSEQFAPADDLMRLISRPLVDPAVSVVPMDKMLIDTVYRGGVSSPVLSKIGSRIVNFTSRWPAEGVAKERDRYLRKFHLAPFA